MRVARTQASSQRVERSAPAARRRALLAFAGLAISCGGGAPEVQLCMRTAPDDPDPLGGPAKSLVLTAIPERGQPEQRFFPPGTRALRLPSLDYGTWQFVVQARGDGDEVVATGRTPFVEVLDEQAAVPCMYVATVGTFGRTPTDPPPVTPRLAFGRDGATTTIVATDAGLLRYDHVTGELAEIATELPIDPAGAIWAELVGGEAVAIARDGRAAIVTASGEVRESLELPPEVGALDGASAAGIGSRTVLVVGGAPDAATVPADAGSLRVVDLDDGAVTFPPSPAGLPIRDARVVPLENLTYVVVGGNEGSADAPVPSAAAVIVDPAQGIIARAELELARRAPMVAVSGSNVLVLGGYDATGAPTTAIDHFRVAARRLVHLPPTDDPLAVARAAGIALPTPDGIVVTGGVTSPPDQDTTAEHFRFDRPPTLCAAGTDCDPPDTPLVSPVATTLHDGAILVVAAGAAVVYRP